ncbi:MAG: twin-arginine translocase TatA/TatE family subunit [Verrucomicrobia bacterium]|nr:twin-arginine translocase TatA/TatE family subunit [Verrucomicrobiota bacterium]
MIFPVTAFMALGGGELIVIMLALLLLFGPKDAPRILRSIQNVLNKLQRAAADFRYKLMYDDLHQTQPEESKDTTVYDAEEPPAEKLPEQPSVDESETHEKSV